nr:unknown function [Klebsiella phage vB_Kpn_K9PH25C2]
MKAIHVKTLSANGTKGLRYKASGLDLCVITPNDYDLNGEANAAYAAQELVDQYNTHARSPVKIVGTGTLPDNSYAVLLAIK